MKITIVTTTINIPKLLLQYAENARYYGHTNVDFVVIGDRKSPSGTAEFCRDGDAVLSVFLSRYTGATEVFGSFPGTLDASAF